MPELLDQVEAGYDVVSDGEMLRADFTRNFHGHIDGLEPIEFFDGRWYLDANADVMRKSHIACHAAAIAWKLGRKLRFDPVTEMFIGDEEANRLRVRSERQPWAI